MEIFDSLLLLLSAAGVLALAAKDLPRWGLWLPLVLAILLILHLVTEGVRWQMVPAYVALAFVLALKVHRRWLRACVGACALLMFAASGIFSWAFPMFDLPRPDGPYAIGTTSVEFVDTDRKELYTDDPNDARRLMLRMWYPAKDTPGASRARYWEEPAIRSRAVTESTPLPWFTFTHLGRIQAFSQWEADIADGTFPVVLYSSGLGIGWSSSNTPLMEQLASHGYIVVGIDHTFLGSAAIFPDRVETFDPATRVALNTPPPEELQEMYSKLMDTTDAREQLEIYMNGTKLMPESITAKVETALHTQVADQKAVLASLHTFSMPVDLAAHMDLLSVGLLGMSLGGSAAIITCASDPLCTAVIDLDGFHPDQASVQLPVPSMMMHRSDNLLVHANFENSDASAYALTIANTTHFNFFDFSIMSPLYAQLGVLGEIDGYRMVEIVCRYTVAFFDEALKGGEVDLLKFDEQPDFPEIKLQRKHAGREDPDAA